MLELISRPVDMELKLGMALNYSLVRVFKPGDGGLGDAGDPLFGGIPRGLGVWRWWLGKRLSVHVCHFVLGVIGTTSPLSFA